MTLISRKPAVPFRHQLMLALLAGILLGPAGARAEGDSFLKKIKPHPHLGFAVRYDDNVFLDPTGKTNDVSFLISPGLQLLYGDEERNFAALDYTLGIERFVDLDDQNAINHLLKFDTHVEAGHIILDLSHVFQDISGANVDVGSRVEEQRNITRAEAEYRISEKTGVGLNYRQEFHDYDATNLTDSALFEVGGSFFYRIQPKTDLLVQLNQGWIDEDSTGADSDYQEVNLGVRGQITSKIDGTAKVGYRHHNFTAAGSDDADMVTAGITLEGKFTERTSAELEVTRTISPSASAAGNSYEVTHVGLILRQRVGSKFTLIARGGYEHDDYDVLIFGVDRSDDYWELGCGVEYEATKWFRAGVHYRYAQNESTTPAVEFEQNVVIFEALFHY